MKIIAEDPERYLATAAKMLEADGLIEASELLRTASVTIEETGYDNWNGGTSIWTIYVLVNAADFAKLGAKQERIEEQIYNRLKPIFDQYSSDWFGVTIAPKVEDRPEWREQAASISHATRRNIFDGLRLDEVNWSGRLDEVEFLQRIYDLESLPSNDSRFKNAAGDIWQHRVNNAYDWDDDWIFDDPRFRLAKSSSEEFLRFLCEVVHPVVRPDRNEALILVQHFNDQLRIEGWELIEEEKIAGRPRFVPRPTLVTGNRSVSRARTVADALNAGWMQKEIERLEIAVDRDPALAIGTAKELVESCCKTILSKRDITFSKNADLPELTKLVAKELSLVPEGIPDAAKGSETIRLILRNLSALTKYGSSTFQVESQQLILS